MNSLSRKPYLLSLLIVAAMAIWLISGQSADVHVPPAETSVAPTKIAPIKVQVHEQSAEALVREIVITGRTAPSRTATVRAETSGRVIEVGIDRGKRINHGDLLVRLATDDREFRLQEALALVKQREFDYQAQQDLLKKGFQPKIQIAEALALLESAKTLVKQAQLSLENTVIRAPFAGVLVERTVEEGDYVSIGDAVAIVSDDNPFLVVGEVTELDLYYLRSGGNAVAQLITGQKVSGKIHFIAVNADPATRTFTIEVEFPNPEGYLAAGLSCEIHFPVETLLAHKISAASLSLSDDGVLGVKTVNANNRVEFHSAQLARATSEYVWLTGLPKQMRLIVAGQGFVRAGDEVQPVLVDKL